MGGLWPCPCPGRNPSSPLERGDWVRPASRAPSPQPSLRPGGSREMGSNSSIAWRYPQEGLAVCGRRGTPCWLSSASAASARRTAAPPMPAAVSLPASPSLPPVWCRATGGSCSTRRPQSGSRSESTPNTAPPLPGSAHHHRHPVGCRHQSLGSSSMAASRNTALPLLLLGIARHRPHPDRPFCHCQ